MKSNSTLQEIPNRDTSTDKHTNAERRIVVICGMRRSGTSWLGKIFDSHPNTLYRSEPDSVWKVDMPQLADPDSANGYIEPLQTYCDSLPLLLSTRTIGPLPVFAKNHFGRTAKPWRAAVRVAAKAASRRLGDFRLPGFVQPWHPAYSHIVWKTIKSTGRLGAMARCLPDATFIHLVRHPCGQIASLYRGERKGLMPTRANRLRPFEELLQQPQAQRRGLTIDRIRSLEPIERMAWTWLLLNEKAMDEIDSVDNARTFRYEDFCLATQRTVNDALAFAGLDKNRQTEEFLKQSTSTGDPRYYGIHKHSAADVEKWREEWSDEQIDQICAVVRGSRPGRLYGL